MPRSVVAVELRWLVPVALIAGLAARAEAEGLLRLTAWFDAAASGQAGASWAGWVALPLALRLALDLVEGRIAAAGFAGFEKRSRTRLLGAFLKADWSEQTAVRRNELPAALGEGIVRRTRWVRATSEAVAATMSAMVALAVAAAVDPQIVGLLLVGVAVGLVGARWARTRVVRATVALKDQLQRHGHEVAQWVEQVDDLRGVSVVDRTVEGVLDRGAALGPLRAEGRIWVAISRSIFVTTVIWVALAAFAWRPEMAAVGVQVVVLTALRQLAVAQNAAQRAVENWPFVVGFEALIGRLVASYSRETAAVPQTDGALSWRGLQVQRGETRLGWDDGQVAPGEHVAIMGPSGAGKTTLVETLMGLWPAAAGEVAWGGVAAGASPGSAWRREFAWVPQDPVLADGTVAEAVVMDRDVDAAAVAAALAAAGYAGDPQRRVGAGGRDLGESERQAVAMARALVGDPRVVVLDEPAGRGALERVARWLGAAAGRTVLLVSHDPAVAGLVHRTIAVPARPAAARG